MRNLVYRVGPKTSDLPSPWHGPKFWGSNCHATKHYIYYFFNTLAPQRHPKRPILAIFGPAMSATPLFGDKIGPHLAPYESHVQPDDPSHHKPTMSNGTPFHVKGPQNHEGQGQEGTHVFNKSHCNTAQGTGGTGQSPQELC